MINIFSLKTSSCVFGKEIAKSTQLNSEVDRRNFLSCRLVLAQLFQRVYEGFEGFLLLKSNQIERRISGARKRTPELLYNFGCVTIWWSTLQFIPPMLYLLKVYLYVTIQ